MRRAVAITVWLSLLAGVAASAKDLPQQDIARVMQQVRQTGAARTWACWHDYPLPQGYVSIDIQFDGTKNLVTAIALRPNDNADLSHTALHRCVEAGFKGIRIPHFPYGPFSITTSYNPADYRPKP